MLHDAAKRIMNDLAFLIGKRILLVEDEALISTMVEDMLTDIGVIVIGPATTIHSALALAESEALDGAILDVNVRGQHIEPVASSLFTRGVPVLFATGYGGIGLPQGGNAALIEKPYTLDKLLKGLARVMGNAFPGN